MTGSPVSKPMLKGEAEHHAAELNRLISKPGSRFVAKPGQRGQWLIFNEKKGS